MQALPVALTRPCPGGPCGENIRGWCAPRWVVVQEHVDTPHGCFVVAANRLKCRYCLHTFPTPPAGWMPPQPTRWPQGPTGR